MRLKNFFLLFLLLISCSSPEKNAPEKVTADFEPVSSFAEENADDFNELSLTTMKLQELYELELLMQKHPTFKKDLKRQLQSLSSKSIRLPAHAETVKINSLEKISPIDKVNDSVVEMKIKFEVTIDSNVKTDSILAIITSKPVEIDGNKSVSKKIRFKPLN